MNGVRRFLFILLILVLAGLPAPPPGRAAAAKIAGAPLVYLRGGPGTTHEPLGVLSEGDRVDTIETVGPWTRVRTPTGREGFVYSTFLTAVGPETGTAQAAEPSPTEAPTPEPEAPAVAEVGAPPGQELPPPTPDPFLLEEVARLRTEIDSLKRRVSEELTASGTEPSVTNDVSDPNLRILTYSLVSLALGWVLGILFSRRRNRTQRTRLRF